MRSPPALSPRPIPPAPAGRIIRSVGVAPAFASQPAMHPIIELDTIWKTYQSGDVQVHAVRGVSLRVEPGEFVAIMGASGSGKSTMMNMLGCLDRPTKGRYQLDGVDVSGLGRDARA